MRHSECTEADARFPRRALWTVVVGGMMLLLFFAAGLFLIPRYRAAHPATALERSDADQVEIEDPYLDLTLVTPSLLKARKLERYLGDRDPEQVLPFFVGLNAHTGSISHIHDFQNGMHLIGPDGKRYPALTDAIVLSQHHNAYMVLFPARDNQGRRFLDMTEGSLTVEVTGLGSRPVRTFTWDLPIPVDAPLFGNAGIVSTLVLIVAMVGAMLVILSPCALELTLYYSAIISWTVGQGSEETEGASASDAFRMGRRRVLINLFSFAAGFTLLYSISGATIGLIGEGVRRPLGPYSRVIQLIGGSLIMFFALRVLGLDRLALKWRPMRAIGQGIGRVKLAALHGIRRLLRRPKPGDAAGNLSGGDVRPTDSFFAGIGLSSSCLMCMGGAVLYPLLVYAGITSWYSGLITLSLYSLGMVIPMMLIALGFFQIRLTLTKRAGVTRALRLTSGGLLTAIAILVLTGNDRLIADMMFSVLGQASRWLG